MSTSTELATVTTEPVTSEPSLPEVVRVACLIAAGEVRDPSAPAISVVAAKRDLNSRGNGSEWHRMVYRDGTFTYFADGRMPTARYLASERRVTLRGDAYVGEIAVQHDRGGPVNAVWLVVGEHHNPAGERKLIIPLAWSKQRDGIRVILPTGTHITVPNPRSR